MPCSTSPHEFLAFGEGSAISLTHSDGTMLARFPPVDGDVHLGERSGFHRSIAPAPVSGFYTSVGDNDNVERRVGYRRLPGFPLCCATRASELVGLVLCRTPSGGSVHSALLFRLILPDEGIFLNGHAPFRA